MRRFRTVMIVIGAVVLALFDIAVIVITFLCFFGIIPLNNYQVEGLLGMWFVASGGTLMALMASC